MLTRYFSIGIGLAVIAGLLFGEMVGGVLGSLVLGFMGGNFACSLVHRLPRGKSVLEHAPYCGACAHPLKELDLLPVIGALMLGHKCRYCGVKFPTTHTWTEILIGLLFVACFVQYGFSEEYLLVAAIGVFWVILACIEWNESIIQRSILVVLLVLGMLYRVMHDASLYNFFAGGLMGLLVGAAIKHREIKPVNHTYTLPDLCKVLAVAGVTAGVDEFWVVLGLFAVFSAVFWVFFRVVKRRFAVTIPLGLAVMTPLLIPGLSLVAVLKSILQ